MIALNVDTRRRHEGGLLALLAGYHAHSCWLSFSSLLFGLASTFGQWHCAGGLDPGAVIGECLVKQGAGPFGLQSGGPSCADHQRDDGRQF
jgi:hypothetical protein